MADSLEQDFDWRLTAFEGARREQLRRWAELALEDIILALEDMEELTVRFQRHCRMEKRFQVD